MTQLPNQKTKQSIKLNQIQIIKQLNLTKDQNNSTTNFMQQTEEIKLTSTKCQHLLNQLKQKIEKFASQHQQALCPQQKKILKLFNYNKWDDFMKWIDEKLLESGEAEQSKLSEIQEEEAELEQSIQENYTLNETSMFDDKSESEILAMENAKLRKENINLQIKIQQLSNVYSSTVSRSYFKK